MGNRQGCVGAHRSAPCRQENRVGWITPIYLSLCLAGCAAHRAAVQPAMDLSKVQRVSVRPFEGAGGAAVADEFVRQWLGSGLEFRDDKGATDVVLQGTVTEYKSNDQRIVFLGNTVLAAAGGQTVVISNPVLSLQSSAVMPEGVGAFVNAKKAQVVSKGAVVGVVARLTAASSGQILWAESFVYEGLDIPSAQHAVVEHLTRSASRVLPSLAKARS
jgi:hypothetical protein